MPEFSDHALENHLLAKTLFRTDWNQEKDIETEDIKHEYQDDDFKPEFDYDQNDLDSKEIKEEEADPYDDGELVKF